MARKNGRELWGKGKARQRTSAAYWKDPLKWNRLTQHCNQCGPVTLTPGQLAPYGAKQTCPNCYHQPNRPRIFPSLCDWLDDEVPIEWLADFLKLIHDTPHLDWLLLTKRPENWPRRIEQAAHFGWSERLCEWVNGNAPPNVWIGASVEDQKRADDRIPELLRIPARVRFLSAEPLLGPVDLAKDRNFRDANTEPEGGWFGSPLGSINWVIIGGESGPGARPCNVEWIRDLVRQCKAASVACFVKQLGAHVTYTAPRMPGGVIRDRSLKHPKGGDPDEWPADLRVRQFPK